jgi:catechol 2,3-dioxygenase-like lactoylglutathione lyase family enzyme
VIVKLHHVAILSSDVDALAARLQDTLGLPAAPAARAVSNDRVELRTTMLPVGNGTYLQLFEPHRGPGVAELRAGGDGALYEVAFEVDDARAAGDALHARGLQPLGLAGEPLPENHAVAGSGSRFLYLPRHLTGGVRVELIQPA